MNKLTYLKYIENVADSHLQSNKYLSTLTKKELNFHPDGLHYELNIPDFLNHLAIYPERDTLLFILTISKHGHYETMRLCYFKVRLNPDTTVDVFDTSYEDNGDCILTEEISPIKQREFVDWVKGFKMFQCFEKFKKI